MKPIFSQKTSGAKLKKYNLLKYVTIPFKCILILCSISFLTCFHSAAQIPDTTKYLEVEMFVTVFNGDTAVSAAHVQQELDQLNSSFSDNNSGIQFVLCGEIQFIIAGFSLAYGENNAPYGNYEKRGAIHIWHCNQMPIAGLANTDRARIRMIGLSSLQLIEHEMGHVLNLPHTHDGGTELVDGSNCSTSGDYICDTPADPGLSTSNVNGSCLYTGTSTDANGDPYNPLTNNFMSYAPHYCRNSFTQGQIDRMNDYLNTSGFFINRIDSVRNISSIPSNYCSTDTSSYGFVPEINAASVTGPGIVGNTFNPSQAGPGLHEVLIQYPADSIVYNDFVAVALSSSISTTDSWNSYTVSNGGILQSVSVKMQVATTTTVNLEIRSGSGIGGTLLYSQLVTLTPTSELVWVNVPISGNLELITGQVYTFRCNSASLFNMSKNVYTYPGADSSDPTPSLDEILYSMVVTIKGTEPCGNIGYRYVHVHVPDNGSILDLNAQYCNTYTNEIELVGTPTNGVFYIDGLQDSLLSPANLSVGNHVLEFISTDINGCPGYISQNISIVDQSATINPLLDSVYCENSPSINLNGAPAGGTMIIDGDTTTILDPSLMNFGMHEVSYIYADPIDTLNFVDEENLIYSGWSSYYVSLPLDSAIWQEFTPSESGYLNNIGVFSNMSNAIQFETILYKGTPSSNNTMMIDTIVLADNGLYQLIFNSVNNIYLYKDTLYSFRVKRINTTLSTSIFPHSFSDDYPNGSSSIDTAGMESYDFIFKTYMFNITECRDTSTITFMIDSCHVGLDDFLSNTEVQVFPNPTDGILSILSDKPISNIVIIDLAGRIVKNDDVNQKKEHSILVSELRAGNYMVHINSDGDVVKKRIVICP